MPYVPLDDAFHSHRKVVYLSDEVGPREALEALGLHMLGLSWAGQSLNDGHVPHSIDERHAKNRAARLREHLLNAGLRDKCDHHARCSRIHDWASINDPADELKTAREKERDRKREWRRQKRDGTRDGTRPVSPVGQETGPETEQSLTGARASRSARIHTTPVQSSPLQVQTSCAEVSTQKKPRRRDHLWDALLATCGIDQAQLTPSARGAVNKAVADLRSVNADPDDIPRRASVYRLRFKDAAMTPTALARHWAECDQWTPPVTRGEQRVAGALVLAERYREEGL